MIQIHSLFEKMDAKIQLKGVTEYSTYSNDQDAVLMIEVQGVVPTTPIEISENVTPTEVVFVIDTSSSMESSMPILNRALEFIYQRIPEHYSVAIVLFDSEVQIHWKMAKMTPVHKEQLKSLKELSARGFTNIAVGLNQGLAQFTPWNDDNIQRVLILLSDGEATEGIRTAKEIIESCQQHHGTTLNHTQIMSMAIGSNVDLNLLKTLSERKTCQGQMYHVETLDALPMALGDCLGTLLTLSATQAILRVEGPNQVQFNVGSLYQGESYMLRLKFNLQFLQ